MTGRYVVCLWLFHHPIENYHQLFQFMSSASRIGPSTWIGSFEEYSGTELVHEIRRRIDWLDRINVFDLETGRVYTQKR